MGKLYGDYYNGIDVSSLKFIGQGTQGSVYFLPPNKAIKIFHNSRSCKDQVNILQCAKNSRFFPNVYDYDDYSIIMDFVPGVNLRDHLSKNKLSEKLAFELVELVCEFERLGFTRLDIRAPHIFVQSDESIIAIDPRKSFQIVQKYPVKILGTLKKFGYLDLFFRLIKNKYSNKYSQWMK
jgi:Predicted Ser/Thr protein kinase